MSRSAQVRKMQIFHMKQALVHLEKIGFKSIVDPLKIRIQYEISALNRMKREVKDV